MIFDVMMSYMGEFQLTSPETPNERPKNLLMPKIFWPQRKFPEKSSIREVLNALRSR